MKIWIAGSVAQYGEDENIKKLIETFKYFDGAFFNVNYLDPKNLEYKQVGGSSTFEILDYHKKEGKVVYTPWLGRHDWAMNAFLNMIPNGDAFVYVDAQEALKVEFLEGMRGLFKEQLAKGVKSIWWNRPYCILEKTPNMQFVGNPHAWLHGLDRNFINIADETKVKYDEGGVHFGDFLYNKKKRENTMLLHGVKYSLYPLPNNQFSMFYRESELQHHEIGRLNFCDHLDRLGYARDLDGLEEFFTKKENLTKEVIDYLNFEFVFRDFYRYKILKHSIDEIMANRYNYKIEYV